MEDCVFCKIVAREIPADFVYEDDATFAFLDIRPDTPGHTLVIPKAHARNIFDLDERSFAPLMKTVQKVAHALTETLGVEGVNIISNNEAAAGQVVFHAHTHVIPRKTGDGLRYGYANEQRKNANPEELSALASRVAAALKD